MLINVYGIYDEASELFVQELQYLNDRVARISLEKAVKENRIKSIPLLMDYPNLYSLYKLGTFDDKLGIYNNLETKELQFNFGSLTEKADETRDITHI